MLLNKFSVIILMLKKQNFYKPCNFSNIIKIVYILFLISCSKGEFPTEPNVRFIDNSNNSKIKSETNNFKGLSLSSSYLENGNIICIYIQNNSKIIKEAKKNEECPPEI